MQQLLRYPHLIVFAYNWRDSQAQSQASSQKTSWESLRKRLNLPEAADTPSEKYHPFEDETSEGFYQYLSLGDTDSLLVACSTKDKEKDIPQDAKCLQKFREKLEVQGDIGKTFLILAHVNSTAEEVHKNAAIAAYQAFKDSQEIPNLEKTDFINCSVYKEKHTLSSTKETVLICIGSNEESMNKVAFLYYDWLWLFYYYHKISWSYQNNLRIKQLLEAEDIFPRASTLSIIKNPLSGLNIQENDLQQLKTSLQKNLAILSKHSAGIESLSVQRQTLKTNLINYQNRLKIIQEKAGNNLKFLEEFRDLIAPRYQEQIEQDIASITPGVRVRENYINTIRGILEVSQAERDRRIETQNRNLQNAIAIAGVGIGTASIAAASVSPFIEVITQKPSKIIENGREILSPSNAVFNFGFSFMISILVGVAFGSLVKLLLSRKHHSDSNQ